MMTSSNESSFRVTGPLCGKFTGRRWISHTKASDAEFCVFFDLHLNKSLSKQSRGWWFETLSRPIWRHCKGSTCCNSAITTEWLYNSLVQSWCSMKRKHYGIFESNSKKTNSAGSAHTRNPNSARDCASQNPNNSLGGVRDLLLRFGDHIAFVMASDILGIPPTSRVLNVVSAWRSAPAHMP